jgi:hypothetical protein
MGGAATTPGMGSPALVTLTRSHIYTALAKSPDGGATLELTHLGLSDVGDEGVSELSALGTDADAYDEDSVAGLSHSHDQRVQRLAYAPI